MKPVAADDLRPSRDFDLRAFLISALLGTAATVAVWFEQKPRRNVGPTAATFDDAARVLAFVLCVLVIGPTLALVTSRRGGRLWTSLAVIPAVGVLSAVIVLAR